MPEKTKELFEEPSTALAVQPDGPAVSITPSAMLQLAASKDVDPDKLQKLMDFAERYQANIAKSAFNEAFTAFKRESFRVLKDKVNSQYSKPDKLAKYVSLENLVATVTPYLSGHDLSARWEIQTGDSVTVTCILSHILGHSQSASMTAPPDSSGAKNPIQQIKSTITYLKGCTFESVCGLASTDANLSDDGNAAGNSREKMPEDVVEEYCDSLSQAPDLPSLKTLFSECYTKAKNLEDGVAKKAFQDVYEAAKRRFLNADSQ